MSFNSRSREGSDRSATHQLWGFDTVSIHAPVKGATALPQSLEVFCFWFQFTLP